MTASVFVRRLVQLWGATALALAGCLAPAAPSMAALAALPDPGRPVSSRPLVLAPQSAAPQSAAPQSAMPTQPAWSQPVSAGAGLDSAHVRDQALEDGRRQITLSQHPIQYQADDGTWREIDPRFQAVPRGFVNTTNSFEASVADRSAALRLRSGDQLIGWEAQRVALTAPGGGEAALAERLADGQPAGALADDGRAIRYLDGWTLPGLAEEITSAAGQVEHNLVFAARPAPREAGAGGWLTLRAVLRLLPGARLRAGGQDQAGAFETGGAVEIRDARGETVLAMAPARAYEQAHPGAGVAGRYRFTPLGDGQWQVAVDTPWAWWADPARAYPAVLDPAFTVVLQAMDIVDIYSLCPSGSAKAAVPPAETDYQGAVVGVGRTPSCGAARTLLRFKNLNQLKLPPGAQIERAELVVAPVYGYYTPWVNGETYPIASVDAQAHWISSDWDPASVTWVSRPWAYTVIDPKNGGASNAMSVWEPGLRSRSGFEAYRWTLQQGDAGRVRQWLEGGSNLGVQLSATDESECDAMPWGASYCRFVGIPSGNAWDDTDRQETASSGLTHNIGYHAGGVMLQIVYTPPALQAGAPQTFNVFPTQPAAHYLRTYHSFAVPAVVTSWMVVGVKGFSGIVPAGSLDLSYQTGAAGEVKSVGARARPNYLLLSPGAGPVIDVHPTDDPPATYRIEARHSAQLPGNPTFTPYLDPYTHTFSMFSNELFRVFDLNLVENSKVSIDVTISPDANKDVEARVYRPVAATHKGSADSRRASSITLGAGEGGKWALVIENADRDSDSVPYLFQVTLVIRACPPNSNPVPGPCKCELIEAPTLGTTPVRVVGSFRVYAKNGFDTFGDHWTTTSPAAGCVAPLVGWGSSTTRLIALGGAPVTYYSATQRLEGEAASVVSLFQPGQAEPALDVWKGDFTGYPHSGPVDYGWLVPAAGVEYLAELLDAPDQAQASIRASVRYQRVQGDAQLDRPIEVSPGAVQTQTFDLTYHVYAEGVGDGSFSGYVTRTAGSASADVAGLALHFSPDWTVDFDTTVAHPGQFTSLRNQGTIVQPENMGGAWKPVQAVILSRLASSQKDPPCGGAHCLEPRATNDTLGAPHPEWDLPDITIDDVAGTVMAGSPGALTVYSVDHPDGASAEVPFSLRTFSGRVKVYRGVCPATDRDPGAENVTVIEGETNLALPGLGSDTDPSQMISTTFKLCEHKLRGVSLAFSSQPGLPVGNTGVFVHRVQGTVTLDPEYTTVQIRIDYQSGASGDLADGQGTVTIDTRGLFDLQTTGKVVGAVDYEGHLWVAWNPLDVGVDVQAWYLRPLLSGQVRAHLWRGQGWQHRYPWLPDNDETHFAGSINAELRIEKGMAFSWWWVDIPPSTWTFNVELAFGQFCVNASCTSYEWGIKGTFTHPIYTLGYEVGVYIGMDTSLDFILGSDDHVLIDQYAGGLAAAQSPEAAPSEESDGPSAIPLINGRPAGFEVLEVADAAAAVVTHPLTVTSGTGSFLAGLSWERGAPRLTLVRPDGAEVTPSNLRGLTVLTSTGAQTGTLLYGARDPMPGRWQAKVSNAAPGDDYHLVFFANKKTPAVAFTAPAADQNFSTNNLTYTIAWQAPATSPLNISLYYSLTEAPVLSPDQTYGGVIVEHLPVTATQFAWNLSYLGSGRYHIYGLVSDPRLAASGSPTQSKPFTLSAEAPGVTLARAPGTIRIADAVPPVMPTLVVTAPIKDAIMTCWNPNPDHDLTGYVVEYRVQDWRGQWMTRTLRVHAAVPYPPPASNSKECARINGLNGGHRVAHRVAAYDASGNLGKPSNWMTSTVSPNSRDTGTAARPGGFTATLGLNRAVVVTWTGSLPACQPPEACDGAFWLFYAREQPAGPGQPGAGAAGGPSPLKITQRGLNAHQVAVEGLAPGFRYSFAVQKQDDEHRRSALTDRVWVLVTDGIDSNHNGLPDDWEAAHDAAPAGGDPDGDGCTNLEEYRARTDPQAADTDGDGYSDCEEAVTGSDPLDRMDISATAVLSGAIPFPRLSLSVDGLAFRAIQGGAAPAARVVTASNAGGRTLTATWQTSAAWLTATPTCRGADYGKPNCVEVRVNPSGLAAGRRTAVITVTGERGSRTQDSPQTVGVELWISRPAATIRKTYLPVVRR
jgi:hypothetical protein